MTERRTKIMADERAAASRRVYASPPVQTGVRVGDVLFEWETRHLSPLRRRLTSAWIRHRRSIGFVLSAVLVTIAAAAAAKPEPVDLDRARSALMSRLRQSENQLRAREGELELAHLELKRLTSIHDYSRRHRIPADLAASIYDIALAEGIDPALAFSLVRVESGFSRQAVSSAGAVGLTQVMPETAFWLQPGISHKELFERDTNLRLGFRYLKLLLRQYRGDLNLALLAYNRGPGTVNDILQAGGDPSNGYSRAVRAGARRSASQ